MRKHRLPILSRTVLAATLLLAACDKSSTGPAVVDPVSKEYFAILKEGDKTWAYLTLVKKSDRTSLIYLHTPERVDINGVVSDSAGDELTNEQATIDIWDNFNAYGLDSAGWHLWLMEYDGRSFFPDDSDYYGKYNYKATVASLDHPGKSVIVEFRGEL